MANIKDKVCALLGDMQVNAAENATQKVNQILEVSSNYLSEPNHEKLKLFHQLYFGAQSEVTTQKSEMNNEVDDIFAQAAAMIDSGKSTEEIAASLKIDEKKESERLQLAGLQKKLESLIAFEDSIKEQLAPVMSSMQFEDAARQRVEHIVKMFGDIVNKSVPKKPELMEEVATSMAEHIAIKSEREVFYKLVLREPVPEHLDSDSDDFFFDLGA